jgi:2-polyprenyl-6-methoxyphenol hydroxylase-like FAD-dependent oxidoreductase
VADARQPGAMWGMRRQRRLGAWDDRPMARPAVSRYVNRMSYDVIVIGGGVAGAALGHALARAGVQVVVIEREPAFVDRVRGECLLPWGAVEAERLGLAAVLRQSGALDSSYWDVYFGGVRADRRDLSASTPGRCSGLTQHHPELQQALLDAAAEAGARVLRGVRVERIDNAGVQVSRGPVQVALSGAGEGSISGRLAVLATGSGGALVRRLGIETAEVPTQILSTGLLLHELRAPHDAVAQLVASDHDQIAYVIPLSRGRGRVYLCAHERTAPRAYSGKGDVPAFLDACRSMGVPTDWLRAAHAGGPLATIRRSYGSASRAAVRGCALVGDAAGNVDPAFGCGLSLAFRDARVLAEALATSTDWHVALEAYASERARYYTSLVRIETWLGRLLFAAGPAGEALRGRALPRLAELGIDLIGGGPDCPSDADTERRLWA